MKILWTFIALWCLWSLGHLLLTPHHLGMFQWIQYPFEWYGAVVLGFFTLVEIICRLAARPIPGLACPRTDRAAE